MDFERIEVEIANHIDLLSLHLKRLSESDERQRAARTINIMSSRTVGLAKQVRRVESLYPKPT